MRAFAIRRPEVLAKVINARWDDAVGTLHWNVDEDAIGKASGETPLALLATIPGALFIWIHLPELVEHELVEALRSDDVRFLYGAAGGIMCLVTLCASYLISVSWIRALSLKSVKGKIANFTAGTEQLKALGKIEGQIRALADEIGTNWPRGMSEDINDFIQREKHMLLVNGEGFRKQVAEAVTQAQEDAQMLSKAKQRHDNTLARFRETARHVNRAGAVTLISEMEAMHQAITSDAMMSLLIERKWREFDEIHKDMVVDLSRIQKQAERYDGEDEAPPPVTTQTLLAKACSVLGVTPTTSCEDIRKRYRQLVSDYHPDRSNQATAAVRLLAEERFKEVQAAWEIVKKEMQIK